MTFFEKKAVCWERFFAIDRSRQWVTLSLVPSTDPAWLVSRETVRRESK
jgi:hypothetical protein